MCATASNWKYDKNCIDDCPWSSIDDTVKAGVRTGWGAMRTGWGVRRTGGAGPGQVKVRGSV